MATNSKNYNLTKPSVDDNYNIDDFNRNSDVIDSELANKLDKATTDTIKQNVAHNKEYYNSHKDTEINSEQGIHNLRCFDDKVEFHDGNSWVQIYTGGRGLHPQNVTSKAIKVGNGQVTISWGDPDNTYVGSELVCAWQGTKLVYKAGSYPLNPNDGIVAVDNTVRNKYKTSGFTITKLTNGVTYYFALFPYSNRGAVNLNTANRLNGVPVAYRTMTVIIDQSNSNPETCCTYADDAVGMTPGSYAWDEWFGYYVTLFWEGKEGSRLQPNDYTKTLDGRSAGIYGIGSGDYDEYGEVMIAHPKKGINITAAGSKIRISVTDNPNAPGFSYKIFDSGYGGAGIVDKLYIGAYKAVLENGTLYSFSGRYVYRGNHFSSDTALERARSKGNRYSLLGYIQHMYLTYLFVLKYKRLDSGTILGNHSANGDDNRNVTGNSNKYGYNTATYGKLFGCEWMMGGPTDVLCFAYVDSTDTVTKGAQMGVSSPTKTLSVTDYQYSIPANEVVGYGSKITPISNFTTMITEAKGSLTTFYCDPVDISRGSHFLSRGGSYSGDGKHGMFSLSPPNLGPLCYHSAHLMYL